MERKRMLRGGLLLPLLGALAVWLASATAAATTPDQAAAALRDAGCAARVALWGSLGLPAEDALPLPLALSVGQSPLLLAARAAPEADSPPAVEAGAKQEQPAPAEPQPPRPEVAAPAEPLEPPADNGVPARTLAPLSAEGYVVWEDVYVDNASDKSISAADIEGADLPTLSREPGPKVLIVHTHGSEAYTMPPGEEYTASGECRTTDNSCNVVRVGEELRAALEAAGIETVHDTALHDYPQYSGAYNRSLESIESWLSRYPTVTLVLDIHRDAVTDSAGTMYKVVSAGGAAQMTFVVGTDGGGLTHPDWLNNLRLACAVQQRLLGADATLMRPITVRNSRYNQHAAPGCLLVEMGAAGNSLEEALRSARLLADAIAQVVLPQ